MFKAIKDLNEMKPKTHLLIKEGNIKKVKLIAKYFQRQFNKHGPPFPEILPAPMKTPFTSGEVRAVIK